MGRWGIAAAAFGFMWSAASAQQYAPLSVDAARAVVKEITARSESVLSQVDVSLTRAVEAVVRNPKSDVILLHGVMRLYAESAPGLRAILVVDGAGKLWVDSFNYPTPNLFLGDRDYVRAATGPNQPPAIGLPVSGRSSGARFIPVSRNITNGLNTSLGVAVGVLNSFSLLEGIRICNNCVAAVILGSRGPLAVMPETDGVMDWVRDSNITEEKEGVSRYALGPRQMHVVWQRSEVYDTVNIIFSPM